MAGVASPYLGPFTQMTGTAPAWTCLETHPYSQGPFCQGPTEPHLPSIHTPHHAQRTGDREGCSFPHRITVKTHFPAAPLAGEWRVSQRRGLVAPGRTKLALGGLILLLAPSRLSPACLCPRLFFKVVSSASLSLCFFCL